MTESPVMSLADIAESVRYGYTASASESEVGPKFLRITDIVPPQIDWAKVPYCEIDEKDLNRFSLAPGDIVIARTGATVGFAKLIREHVQAVFASYLVRVRVNPEKAEPRYVGRVVESEVYRRFVLSRAGGAAQPNANAKVLSSFRLRIPERRVQIRIANILSAYDDLIENNRRRIQLLEQAARLLYREWFVLHRFPDHEHVRVTDGVPEGWRRFQLVDLCQIGRGASPRPINKFMGGSVPWFKIGDATSSESPFVLYTKEKVTDDGAAKSVLLGPESLILSNSATCGIPFFTGIQGCVHDGWLHFRDFGRIDKYHLFCLFNARQNELLQVVGDGSTQKNLNTKVVGRLGVVLPVDDGLIQRFRTVVEPMFSMMFTLARKNASLRNACDLLLPRFMNGEIAV